MIHDPLLIVDESIVLDSSTGLYLPKSSIRRRWSLYKTFTLGTQVSLALIGIIALVIYHGQLTKMTEQLTEMKGSSEQTSQLLCLYKEQLDQLQMQTVNNSKIAFGTITQATAVVRAEAAQIKIDRQNTLSLSIGHEIVLPFVIENIGKTAAIHPRIVSFSGIYEKYKEPDFLYPRPPKNFSETGFSYPGDKPVVFQSTVWRANEKAILDQPTADRLLKKEIYLVTWGKITYNDVFGVSHWAKFCSWQTLSGDVDTQDHPKCAAYNQTDSSIVPTTPKITESGSNTAQAPCPGPKPD